MYKNRREPDADQLCEPNLPASPEEAARGDTDCESSWTPSSNPRRETSPRPREEEEEADPALSELDLEETLHSVSKQLVLKYWAAGDWAAVGQLAVGLSANCSRIEKLERRGSAACRSSEERPASPMEQAMFSGAEVTTGGVPVASPEEEEEEVVSGVTDGVEEGEKVKEHSEQVMPDLTCHKASEVVLCFVDGNEADCANGTRYQVTACVCGEHLHEANSVKVSHNEFYRLIEKLPSKVDTEGVRDLCTQLSESFTSRSNGEESKGKCERLAALFNQVLQNPELQSDRELLEVFAGPNPSQQMASSEPPTANGAAGFCLQGLPELILFLVIVLHLLCTFPLKLLFFCKLHCGGKTGDGKTGYNEFVQLRGIWTLIGVWGKNAASFPLPVITLTVSQRLLGQ